MTDGSQLVTISIVAVGSQIMMIIITILLLIIKVILMVIIDNAGNRRLQKDLMGNMALLTGN